MSSDALLIQHLRHEWKAVHTGSFAVDPVCTGHAGAAARARWREFRTAEAVDREEQMGHCAHAKYLASIADDLYASSE